MSKWHLSLPLNEEKEQGLGVGVPGRGKSKRGVPEVGATCVAVVWQGGRTSGEVSWGQIMGHSVTHDKKFGFYVIAVGGL